MDIFRLCDEGKEIIVIPSIVLLECMYVCEKQRLEIEFQEVMRKIQGTINYPIYPLDEEIIMECQNIRQIPEMHDRIIVATAKLFNATLITKDSTIIDSKIIRTVW